MGHMEMVKEKFEKELLKMEMGEEEEEDTDE